jgi:P4 family phage/plasmid primase-like protien
MAGEQNVYRRFFSPDEVVEIRALGLRGKDRAWDGFCTGAGVVAGYFDNGDDFDLAAAALDEVGATGVYFSLNPVNPDLLARAVNRLVGSPKYLTQDTDIVCLRWLPIDLDPVRPAGISSTEKELRKAADVARKITGWLEGEMAFPKGLRACSGNGFHLCYRLPDLPNDTDHRELIRQALAAVAAKFTSSEIEIDLKVGNPARIWKLYGTIGRKGDHTEARPHRRSYLFPDQATTLAEVGIIPIKDFKKLAGLAPKGGGESPPGKKAARQKPQSRKATKSELGPLDVGAYLDHYGAAYSQKTGPGGVTIYRLERCVFDPNHGRNEAAINQALDGTLTYQCFHNSCKGRTWREAREIISGNDNLAPFCEGWDPNWEPSSRSLSSRKESGSGPTSGDNGDGGADAGYLVENDRGRIKFVPALMANYLESQLRPIIYEGTDFSRQFYRYHESGVWKPYPRDAIRLVIRNLLGDHAKPAWIDAAVDVLGAQIFKMPEELTFDPMLLNLRNGMLNINTFELRPHAPEFHSRVQLPVSYRENSTCSRWIEALAQIFADDTEKASVLQEFAGYCLYPKILFPCALFQIGSGRNGKGIVEKVLCAMLGRENVSHISLARLEETFGPVEIQDKLLNSCGETETRPLEVTNFKKIAAGDEVQAQRKYLPDVKFTPFAKHLISMNSFPGVKEKTDAFFRRIIVLEYKQKFEGLADDKRLADKLIQELDGIFAWAFDGLKRVLEREEIVSPTCVIQAKERFREKVNPVLGFVNEVCLLGDGASDDAPRVLPADLYRAYQDWIEDAKLRPLGKNNFYEQLYLNFPAVRKRRYGKREFFFGIGLRTS